MARKALAPEEIKARKKNILDAAEKIFFSKGISDSSMDQVAKEANVGKGSLYLYFDSKKALYRGILKRAYITLKAQIEGDITPSKNGLENILEIANAYKNFSLEHLGYFDSILFYENDILNLKTEEDSQKEAMGAGHEVLRLLIEAIEKGQKDGSVRSSIKPVETSLVLWAQTTGMLQITKSKGLLIRYFYNIREGDIMENFMQQLIYSLENRN